MERSFPTGAAFAELGAMPDQALAAGRLMAVTDVKKAMDTAGHGLTHREACGPVTRYRKATHPAREWFRHRGLGVDCSD
jgi:hypothetical protein